MRWIGYVATIIWWSSVARSLSTLNRGYKISPKPCRVHQSVGGSIQGTCMFVWECIKSEGTHVGVCVDTFMFGSCCVHKNDTITPHTTTDSSTTLGHHSLSTILSSVSSVTVEPSRLSDTTLNIAATSRPGGSTQELTVRPVRPIYSVSHTNRPKRPYPQSHDFQSSPARLPDDGKNQMVDEDEVGNQRIRPGDLYLGDKPEKTAFTNVPPPPPPPPPIPPATNQHYSNEKEEDNVITNETHGDPLTAASINAIRTEKPPAHWLITNSPSSSIYSSLKTPTYRPGTVFGHSASTETRPDFISKPHDQKKPSKLWTTSKSTYLQTDHTSTSTESSLGQTTHWHVTTEPAFVTKQKNPGHPSSPSRPGYPVGHFWGDNTWSHPPSEERPSWTDDRNTNGDTEETNKKYSDKHPVSENHQNKPGYGKPHYIPSSHYITTADVGSLTRPKPTRRRTPQPPRVVATTIYPVNNELSSIAMTTAMRTTSSTPRTTISTTVSTTVSTTMTTTTTTESVIPKKSPLGSVPTVSAVPANSESGKERAQCGVPPLFPRPETRIVGGKAAPFGRWPWQVSVRRTSFFGFSSTHRCGGAVLNENWIATAGHCVDDLLTSQIRIRVGDYDFSSVQERLPYVERGIAKKVVHPKYNFFTYEYDLALVRLESSLVFAPHISPICLPATDDLLVGENATVTGWGRLSEGGTLPSVLQEVSVPIVSNDRCKSMFLRAGRHEFIPDIFLCAGYENGGRDSCQGDSGGPLQVRGKDGRYFLAGIISWGIGCAEANLPGVCTRISKFVPWILKNVT
ncbi:serine proteinase stubble isoform X2 [Fopius arisanus]|uniref:Serine proteinase stubble isoform X2 n=1 Tax=Fopius arisanus TaxID=64838 RepID=A0A9R1TUU8_9HYME|nr:PREDICTED: serine proteinase stubble isoform X2 [Fopius arisanus]